MEFKKIELSDRDWMNKLLSEGDLQGSEYCFSNSYNWRDVYGVYVGQTHNRLVIQCTKPTVTYAYPVGSGDLKGAVLELIDHAARSQHPLVITCIPQQGKHLLEQLFPQLFVFTCDRDICDYIYDRESLTTLGGKKLQSKRNHISKFKNTYPDWVYEAITPQNLEECREMSGRWCKKYGCEESEGLSKESCAVQSAFAHFADLHLQGGLLRCTPDGEVVAYSIGTQLNSNTYIVHIEKAYHDIQGAYPLINQQFVTHNCQQFCYINREDDMGSEGLRKAKLSYRPAIILDKYYAVLRDTP